MDRDDAAYKGQREYTPLFLKIYDPLILRLLCAGRVAVPDDPPRGGIPAAPRPQAPRRGSWHRLLPGTSRNA